MWISNSDIAGVFLVFANANSSAVSNFLYKREITESHYITFYYFY